MNFKYFNLRQEMLISAEQRNIRIMVAILEKKYKHVQGLHTSGIIEILSSFRFPENGVIYE